VMVRPSALHMLSMVVSRSANVRYRTLEMSTSRSTIFSSHQRWPARRDVPYPCWRRIRPIATPSTDLSIRQIQSKIAGRASRGIRRRDYQTRTRRPADGPVTTFYTYLQVTRSVAQLRTISLSRRCQDADAGLCRKRHQVPDLFRSRGANSGKGAPASIFMPGA
jgi:hypothetical protein